MTSVTNSTLKLSAFQKTEFFASEMRKYQLPIGRWVDLKEAPSDFIKEMEGECQGRFNALKGALEAAEKVRKDVFEKMRPTLLKLNIGVGAVSGLVMGFVAAGRFSILAAVAGAVIGALFGAILGILVGRYHAKVKAATQVLPEMVKLFQPELAWLETKLAALNLKIETNPPEKEQLLLFKKHLEETVKEHKDVLAAKTENEPVWLQNFNAWRP